MVMLVAATKEFLAFLLRASGIPWVIRESICRNRVTIILYHDPTPEALERHLRYLSKHYHFISLSSLVDAIYARDWSTIPVKSLVVNIDDGYVRNYKLLDVLKRYDVVPTLYVCSHIVGGNRHFWSRLNNGRAKAFTTRGEFAFASNP